MRNELQESGVSIVFTSLNGMVSYREPLTCSTESGMTPHPCNNGSSASTLSLNRFSKQLGPSETNPAQAADSVSVTSNSYAMRKRNHACCLSLLECERPNPDINI